MFFELLKIYFSSIKRWRVATGSIDFINTRIESLVKELCYYIHFWTNTLGKGINPLFPNYRLNRIPLLSFNKNGFGFKLPTKGDMPLNKETKTPSLVNIGHGLMETKTWLYTPQNWSLTTGCYTHRELGMGELYSSLGDALLTYSKHCWWVRGDSILPRTGVSLLDALHPIHGWGLPPLDWMQCWHTQKPCWCTRVVL